ncbi:MAG TPA: aldehyde dehydrogenase family protein [Pusillimonas sp.]|uniref:aldehyde dehydrogenase family protein n=1 Tax=Pusillimonas sp. TaxID=3040095 RepID=UPI002B4B28E2|nr:aldehyde dehydrogenase family protein [Pusillimonas sp.]HLU20477.1 aldehyde dehydrogenase family protein [Pusillimonas sp.]
MRECLKFYIDGHWVKPVSGVTVEVINPATEQISGSVAMGAAPDVDRAVKAARVAFESYSKTRVEERAALLARIADEYRNRFVDMAEAISEEMGAPAKLAREAHSASGLAHIETALAVLKRFAFQETLGSTLVVKEPIGVCALITPWNWPANQIACKVAPALAVGSPSE